MLRPCVFTDGISQDLEHALDVCAEFNVRDIEIRDVWGKCIVALDDSEVTKIRQLVKSRGVAVASLATPFFKCDLPGFSTRDTKGDLAAAEQAVRDHVAMLRRATEICDALEAPVIRGFAFWRPNHDRAGLPRDAKQTSQHLREIDVAPDAFQRMVDLFAEPVRIVETAGVTFGLENESACCVGRSDEQLKLAEALDSKNFRLTWDAANAFFSGQVPYPDGYDLIRGRVAHVHVKDVGINAATGEAVCCRIGAGEVDWVGQFRALAKDGFDGAVSVETHHTPPNWTREVGTREDMSAIVILAREVGWMPGAASGCCAA